MKNLFLIPIIGMIIGSYISRPFNVDPILATMKHDYSELQNQIKVMQEEYYYNSLDNWGKIRYQAQRIAKEEDYPVNVILAQAHLESRRGESEFCRERYNCFGINAMDANPNLASSYSSLEDGIRSYVHLIKTYYKPAYEARSNPIRMVELIKAGGYATDPRYVSKVINQPEFNE